MKHKFFEYAIKLLYFSGTHKLFDQHNRSLGSILMFHRVLPSRPEPFAPNSSLSVTPEFFAECVRFLRRRGNEIVTMSELYRRITARENTGHLVVLTFDDGFRDNYDFAFPICQALRAPMVIYLTTGFLDGTHPIWTLHLERIVRAHTTINFNGSLFDAAGLRAKQRTFARLNEIFKKASAAGRVAMLSELDALYPGFKKFDALDWEMTERMRDSGLVEFGSHTVTHPDLSLLDPAGVAAEMRESAKRIENRLGTKVRHFAYPYGRAEAGEREFKIAESLGFDTVVTTRHGNITPSSSPSSLPRLSINGLHQSSQALEVFLSGTSGAIYSLVKKANSGRPIQSHIRPAA